MKHVLSSETLFQTEEIPDFGIAEIGPPDPEIGRISRSDPRIRWMADLRHPRHPRHPWHPGNTISAILGPTVVGFGTLAGAISTKPTAAAWHGSAHIS